MTAESVTASAVRADAWLYLKLVLAWRKTIIAAVVPLLLLPLIFCFEDDLELKDPMRCAYVLSIMIVYWTTEAMHNSVTALIPMVLYPLMSLVKASELAPLYMSESNMSFIGSILVIGCFERAQLHKRFALWILTMVGVQPRWILAGFMTASWFVSLWCSNTMTVVILLPNVMSVVAEIENAVNNAATARGSSVYSMADGRRNSIRKKSSHGDVEAGVDAKAIMDAEASRKFENMLIISVTYAASIGGAGTTVGAGANFIIKEFIEEAFVRNGCSNPINFLSWLVFCLPMTMVIMFLLWWWLLIRYSGPLYTFGCKTSELDDHKQKAMDAIQQLYKKLPPISVEQIVVLAHCLAMILLLVTREMSTVPLIGWELLAPGYVKESTATITVAISLFLFPISMPYLDLANGKIVPPKMATSWSAAEKSFPVGVVLLIGGGMAAAYGAEKTGLADLIANLLYDLCQPLDDLTALAVMVGFMTFLTQLLSNNACVTLMMPIAELFAVKRDANPLLFMFPTAIASSFSYMLPASTRPNAVAMRSGKLRIWDLVSSGFVLCFISIGALFMIIETYGASYLHLYDKPWTIDANGTVTCTIDF